MLDWKIGSKKKKTLPIEIIARLFSYQAHDILKISSRKIKALPARRTLSYERGGSEPKGKSSWAGGASVSAERFELSTNGLKGHCSAIELRAHLDRMF